MNGTLHTSETLLRKRINEDLRRGEEYVAGAAGKTKLRLLPQSMSLTGYYVALTTQRVILYHYDRLTSRPAGIKEEIEIRDIESNGVETTVSRNSIQIRLTGSEDTEFHLVFSGREKRSAALMASSLKASLP